MYTLYLHFLFFALKNRIFKIVSQIFAAIKEYIFLIKFLIWLSLISVWKDLLKHAFTYFNPCNGEMKSEKMCAFKVLFKKFENIFTGKYLFNFVIIQHLWIKFENISASFDYSETNNANDNYYWLGNYNNTCRNHCTNNTDTHNNCYHHRGSVLFSGSALKYISIQDSNKYKHFLNLLLYFHI